MTGLFEPEYHGDLSFVEQDPRLLDLAMRQHKASSAFIARQSQEFVRVALTIRRELLDQAYRLGYDEGLGDVGMTYDGDPDSARSRSYDEGRIARRAYEGIV